MIVNYTDEEKKKQEALEKKYEKLIAEAEAEKKRNAPTDPPPDLNIFFDGINPHNAAEMNKASQAADKAYKAWEQSGGEAYTTATKRCNSLMRELAEKRRELFLECEQRQFSELSGDLKKIKADFEEQVPAIIALIYQKERQLDAQLAKEGGGKRSSIYIVATNKGNWKLYAPEIIATIKRSLHLHLDFVEDNEKQKESFTTFLETTVYSSPYVATITQGKRYNGTSSMVEIAAAPGVLPVPATDVLQNLSGRRVKKEDYPIDKLNNNIWRGFYTCDTNGQISFDFDVKSRKDKSDREILVLYSLSFDDMGDDVKITKKLEPYDKRVYIAAAALYNAGNTVISIAQIYKAMGFDGKPGKGEREKINASMSKMRAAVVHIDNSLESQSYNRPRFKYDSSLLPFERAQAIINGQVAESAFHLFREPPLVSFARERKQITTLDRKLLQTPLSKTNQNLLIEDYLIDHITAVKSGRRGGKLLYKTIYENTGITTIKQKQRAPEKIEKLLTFWKENGYITNFTEENDGITIFK